MPTTSRNGPFRSEHYPKCKERPQATPHWGIIPAAVCCHRLDVAGARHRSLCRQQAAMDLSDLSITLNVKNALRPPLIGVSFPQRFVAIALTLLALGTGAYADNKPQWTFPI